MIRFFGAGFFLAGLLLFWSATDPSVMSPTPRRFFAGVLIGIGLGLFFVGPLYHW